MNFLKTLIILCLFYFPSLILAVEKPNIGDLNELVNLDGKLNSATEAEELPEDIDDLTFLSMVDQALKLRQKNDGNFSAGPGMNSTPALKKLILQMLSYKKGGIGIQELSHRERGGHVQKLILETKNRVRRILNVPNNYEVLFMTGGAHFQFDAIPANLLKSSKQADFIDGGFWSKRAKSHVDKLNYTGRLVEVLQEDPKTGKISVKPEAEWDLSPDSAYVHICDNETISGIQFRHDPKLVGRGPLVTDATSSLLSRKMQIENYGIIYASGGKNLGPAGVTLVIVRRDLLQEVNGLGLSQEYKNISDYANLYNTPDIISITSLNEHLKIVEKQGLEAIEKRAIARSNEIYSVIDNSKGFYVNKIDSKWRSTTTIPFRIREQKLEAMFIKQAEVAGFHQVKGHHSVGGLRVSLYNPIPDEAVSKFARFLKDFQQNYAN